MDRNSYTIFTCFRLEIISLIDIAMIWGSGD
jgi:hypothetical protein